MSCQSPKSRTRTTAYAVPEFDRNGQYCSPYSDDKMVTKHGVRFVNYHFATQANQPNERQEVSLLIASDYDLRFGFAELLNSANFIKKAEMNFRLS